MSGDVEWALRVNPNWSLTERVGTSTYPYIGGPKPETVELISSTECGMACLVSFTRDPLVKALTEPVNTSSPSCPSTAILGASGCGVAPMCRGAIRPTL